MLVLLLVQYAGMLTGEMIKRAQDRFLCLVRVPEALEIEKLLQRGTPVTMKCRFHRGTGRAIRRSRLSAD